MFGSSFGRISLYITNVDSCIIFSKSSIDASFTSALIALVDINNIYFASPLIHSFQNMRIKTHQLNHKAKRYFYVNIHNSQICSDGDANLIFES